MFNAVYLFITFNSNPQEILSTWNDYRCHLREIFFLNCIQYPFAMLIFCKSTPKSENDERERRALPEFHHRRVGCLSNSTATFIDQKKPYFALLVECKGNQRRNKCEVLDIFSVLCRPLAFFLAGHLCPSCHVTTQNQILVASPPGMQAGNVICFVTQFIVKNQVVLRCEKRACAFSSSFKKRRRAKELAWIINHKFCQIKS